MKGFNEDHLVNAMKQLYEQEYDLEQTKQDLIYKCQNFTVA